ncbi:MAG: DUF1996 domain-containing protein [Acidimicrobiia bacterium]
MPQNIFKKAKGTPIKRTQKQIASIAIVLSILAFGGIYSFASDSDRSTSAFNANNATSLQGSASLSNGVVNFSDPTTTTTTPGTNEPYNINDYWVTDSWTNGGIPKSDGAGSDGAFRFNCNPSHLAYVDPIVFPGQNGASHLHMFYGNKKTNYNSTQTSLKNTGGGSCDGGPLNRTAYWIPAMLDTNGKARLPINTVVYYKVTEASISKVQTMPEGLRMIAGNAKAMAPQNTGHIFYKFKCVDNNGNGSTIFDEQFTIGNCPSNSRLYMNLAFPQCWDGVNLDSADHKSHLTYLDWGATNCPSTHPVLLPQVSLNLAWETGSGTSNGWYFSSDDMTSMGMGKMPGGTTVHADWFMAWDDTILTTWTNNCLKKQLSCFGGQTGDGKNLKRVPLDYPGPLSADPPATKTDVVNLPNSGLAGQ